MARTAREQAQSIDPGFFHVVADIACREVRAACREVRAACREVRAADPEFFHVVAGIYDPGYLPREFRSPVKLVYIL